MFIDDTNGDFSEETLTIQKGNIHYDLIDSRYLNIGRSSTNQNTIKGFNGKMAAFSIINRELKNIEEIKLLSVKSCGVDEYTTYRSQQYFNTFKWIHWFK